MEEAEGSLENRLEACGGKGLPIEELLRHMRDAAEGIDHLEKQNLQHRDIKPANLLLVGGRVKVGDFGLAKILERTRGSHSGPMTPLYAPPEWLQGVSARQSDQYSLAVTYFRLRTGSQLLDLTLLPPREAQVVTRATSEDPENRWPSCLAFVEALGAAVKAATTVPKKEEEALELTLLEELVLLSHDSETGENLVNRKYETSRWTRRS